MTPAIIDSRSSKSLGVSTRKSRPGPEDDLVDSFVKNLETPWPKDYQITVFKEPRLESGAPDLVLIIWNKDVISHWTPERFDLQKFDLRLLHYIFSNDYVASEELCLIWGKIIDSSLTRLQASNMIFEQNGYWETMPIEQIYSIKHICAIEAKMSSANHVLDQATLNLWFAQSSYVLVPKPPRQNSFLERAEELGVGVLFSDDYQLDEISISEKSHHPISYVSWLFNEWVLRQHYLCTQKGL